MKCRSGRKDIVDDDDVFGNRPAYFKSPRQIQRTLRSTQPCLAGGVFPPPQNPGVEPSSQPFGKQLRLIKSTLAFSAAMQRYRNDDGSLKSFPIDAMSQRRSQRTSQRNPIGILQMVNDFAERVIEDVGGARKIKSVLLKPARRTTSANIFGRRFRQSTLRTIWRPQRFHLAPARRANRSPLPFQNGCAAKNARKRKEQIQYGVGERCVGHGIAPWLRKGQTHFIMPVWFLF